MTAKLKSWVERNFNLQAVLLLIIAAMLSAFWTSYENDRNKRDAINARQDEKIIEQQIISYNLARTVEQLQINQKECDIRYQSRFDHYDEQLMEVWKQVKRGQVMPDMSDYKKVP